MVRVSEPLILGIESTCDETGVALVRGCDLLVDRTATSMDLYARYGGIIPEIASRAHLESFLPTLDSALQEAGVSLSEVDAVAVSAGPGLVGSLTVGICAATTSSISTAVVSFAKMCGAREAENRVFVSICVTSSPLRPNLLSRL